MLEIFSNKLFVNEKNYGMQMMIFFIHLIF